MRAIPEPTDVAQAAFPLPDRSTRRRLADTRRWRPLNLPEPAIVQDSAALDGYHAVAFWPREDAFLLHPPRRAPVCAVCRGVPVTGVVQAAAAVHAAREDGPVIGFAIGICAPGVVDRDNWSAHVGPVVHVAPGDWGVVSSPFHPVPGPVCDLILVTQVAGSVSNENAWALFRRFSFKTVQH